MTKLWEFIQFADSHLAPLGVCLFFSIGFFSKSAQTQRRVRFRLPLSLHANLLLTFMRSGRDDFFFLNWSELNIYILQGLPDSEHWCEGSPWKVAREEPKETWVKVRLNQRTRCFLRSADRGRKEKSEKNWIDEFRMLWLPWATHRKVWHKMEVWTATRAGWPSKRLFCAILFYASPRATKACETRLYASNEKI